MTAIPKVIPKAVPIRSVSPLLQVRDLARSLEFYTKRLGFTQDWFDGVGFAIVRRGDCSVYLAQREVEVDLRNRTARRQDNGYANYDLHFYCDGGTIDALWEEYQAIGIEMPSEFAGGPVDREYGIRDFSLSDPDGYVLVFGAPCQPAAG